MKRKDKQESKQAKNPWLPIIYVKQYSIKQKILIYKDINILGLDRSSDHFGAM